MPNIYIDENKCKGCALCISVCPKNCLKISNNFNKAGYHPAVLISQEKCIGCGFCYQMCPDVCIDVFK